MSKIPCFSVKRGDLPVLIGERCELDELVELLGELKDGDKFTVEAISLTDDEYNNLPDWDP